MKIKNIVFDFGGVLVDWNPIYLFKDEFSDPSEMNYFLTHVCNNTWNVEQDRGRSFAEGIKLLQEKHPKYSSYIQTFFDKWGVMMGSDIPENVVALYKVKKLYRVFGLTNWSAETLPLAYKRFPFFKEFEGVVVSGEEKLVKPDQKLFQILLDRYELIPEESLFIDDNLDNIKAANRMGFETIHIQPEMNLIVELKKMELI
ncbi:HAD family hydrolase [Ancylomarina sp. YFZ004]